MNYFLYVYIINIANEKLAVGDDMNDKLNFDEHL
jgi:hypothetical protein